MTRIMTNLARAALIGFVAASVGAQTAPAPGSSSAAKGEKTRQLTIASKPFTGDFEQMLERRIIRVYAPYSRSLYFIDKGRERGLGAELVRDFERWVNQKHAKKLGKRPLTVYIVAATRDKLLPDLTGGQADIAIGNLTVNFRARARPVFQGARAHAIASTGVQASAPARAPPASCRRGSRAGRR